MSQFGGFFIVVILFALAIVLGIIVYYVEIKENSEVCKTDSDCDGLKCVNQKCVCTDNSQCQSGEICSNGFCIAQKACTADADCPSGQICTNGQCATDGSFILDIVAVTSQGSCPAGYEPMEGIPAANGNLKQGTGTGTPNIFLCLQRGPDVSQGSVTDLTVAKFYDDVSDTNLPCTDAAPNTSAVVYGDDEDDFSEGCGISSPITKLCYGKSGPNRLTDIVVVNGSGPQFCPANYFQISTFSNIDTYTDQTANLNEDCGGPVIQLCGKY